MFLFQTSIGRIRPSALATLLMVFTLGACGGRSEVTQAPDAQVDMQYEPVQDDGILIPGVHPGYVTDHNRRQEISFSGEEGPGTIIVDPYARFLYFVLGDGRAMRYGIAVGREGKGFSGKAVIKRKAEWPGWTPTANMIRTEPEVYAEFKEGLPGGLDNPLGARALYLYRGSRDTHYRIHGTNNASTIGRATSAGCIRLFNQDAIDLYNRVPEGTQVVVRTPAQSLADEGEMVELENGYLVPVNSPEADAFRKRNGVIDVAPDDVFMQISN
jgi:lipoprotein-anchoring transpeptidase ErfK/SrfK